MNENDKSSTVGVFPSHVLAEGGVRALQRAGFDMKRLSIVGREYQTEEQVVGFYNLGDRMVAWGSTGLFWGAMWGLLFGSAMFVIPGLGAVLVGGPLVVWMVGVLETAVLGGGLGALAGAFATIGIPKDSIVKYQTALKANKFMVIVHGAGAKLERARDVLMAHDAEEATVHHHEAPRLAGAA